MSKSISKITQVQCPFCGTMNLSNRKVCFHCGKELPANPALENDQEENGSQNQDSDGNAKLIHCSACDKLISVEATSCPHCGQPTEFGKRAERLKKETEQKKQEDKAAATAYLGVWIIASIVGIIGVVLLIKGFRTMMNDMEYYYYLYNYKSPLSSHESGVIFQIFMGFVLMIGDFLVSNILKKQMKKRKK